MKMAVEQRANRAAQGACAVPVNDSYLAQTRQRCFVEKLVNRIDCFVRGMDNHMYHKWWG